MNSTRWIKGARSVQLDSKFAKFNLNLLSVCVYLCRYFFFHFKFVSAYFFCLLFHLVQCGTCSTWIACKNFTLVEKISWIRQQKFSLPWFHYKNKNKTKTSTHNHKANFNWFLPRFSFHPFSQLILFLYIFACGLFMQLLFPVVSLEVFVSPSTRQLNIKYSLKRERYYLRYTLGVYMYFDKQWSLNLNIDWFQCETKLATAELRIGKIIQPQGEILSWALGTALNLYEKIYKLKRKILFISNLNWTNAILEFPANFTRHKLWQFKYSCVSDSIY